MTTAATLRAALEEVLDPEYPISVVDRGLIRGVELEGTTAKVRLTLCSLGCPCTELILEDVEARLLQLPGVERVEIEEVYDPWSRKDISRKGLKILSEIGVG